MSVGSWQPEPQSLNRLGLEQLQPLLDQVTNFPLDDQTPDIAWSEAELSWITPLAKADKSAWTGIAAELTPAQLKGLIGFFTVLEQQQNWDLAEKSPVIPLFKALKKVEGLDRELVQWVKNHTDNKFLPFGPLL